VIVIIARTGWLTQTRSISSEVHVSMSILPNDLPSYADTECMAPKRSFPADGALNLCASPSNPEPSMAALRREIDALAWVLVGRLTDECAAGDLGAPEIPLDRTEGRS